MRKIRKSIPALADYLAALTGEPKSVLGHVARRLREAGDLSQAGHGSGAAESTSTDAATLLLVSMATRKAVHAPIVAQALHALERVREKGVPNDIAGLRLKERDPISVLAKLIDAEMSGNTRFEGIHFVRVVTTGIPEVYIFWAQDLCWAFERPQGSRAFSRYRKIKSSTSGKIPYVSHIDVMGSIVQSLANWLEDE